MTDNNTTNWNTEEMQSTIANDEGLYDLCNEFAERCNTISELADKIETEMADIIPSLEYCQVDTEKVDWFEVGKDIIEATMEEDYVS